MRGDRSFLLPQHWNDCPFPTLIVNRLRVRSNFLQPITVGPDRGWASNMQVALAQIAQPYVLNSRGLFSERLD
jgi:hypothetical protein